MSLPTDKTARKERPIARGVLDYFPDAVAAVANVSFVGNQQHNPGEEMHWSRGKSADHSDCVARHLIERGTIDDDGLRHSAKLAWRALALLQIELEEAEKPDAFCVTTPDGGCKSRDPRCMHNQPEPNYNGYWNTSSDPDDSACWQIVGDRCYFCRTDGTISVEDQDEYNWVIERIIDGGVVRSAWLPKDVTHNPASGKVEIEKVQLLQLGCPLEVAHHICAGTTCPAGADDHGGYVYVAGPMRGYDKFNFPAFDAARDCLLQNGWNVVSPANIDRASGFHENKTPGDAADPKPFIFRDFFALYFIAHQKNGAIAMLPGWEKSTGAVGEFFLARWLGLRILDARTGNRLSHGSIYWGNLIDKVVEFLVKQESA